MKTLLIKRLGAKATVTYWAVFIKYFWVSLSKLKTCCNVVLNVISQVKSYFTAQSFVRLKMTVLLFRGRLFHTIGPA